MTTRARRWRRRLGWFALGLGAAAAGAFALQAFVGSVYLVRTPSMAPTIGGDGRGEWVLVRYLDADELERFDLVVFTEPGESTPVVKRVIGLPSERVQIVGGDVLIDGERLAPGERWPVLVPVFDSRVLGVEDAFHLGSADAWTKVDGVWLLDALEVQPGSSAGTMGLHRDVGTGYMRPDGERTPDVEQANDVVAIARIEWLEGDGHVLVEVLEERDRFQARVGRGRPGSDAYWVELWRLDGPGEPWATATFPAPTEASFDLRVANVDNRVTVAIDGEVVIERTYEANRPYLGVTEVPEPGRDPARRTVRRSIGQRAVFGGVGVRARFERLVVERDLYFATGEVFGPNAIDAPLELGPGEYFVLGDNTADSVDGRRTGALFGDRVVGRATSVVWPPSRARRLR